MSEEPRIQIPPGSYFPAFRAVAARLRLGRWVRGCAYVFLVLLLLAGIADGVATVVLGQMVRSRLRALQAAGKPVAIRSLSPPPVADSDNAAPLYLEAASIIERRLSPATSAKAGLRPAPGEPVDYRSSTTVWDDPHALHTLAQFVTRDRRALELVAQATDRPQCRFDVGWDQGPEVTFQHLTKARELARFLTVAAVVAAWQGDQTTALERLRMGYRLGTRIAQEPTLIAQLVAYAVDAILYPAAAYVLSRGALPEGPARKLVQDVDRHQYSKRFQSAIDGERAFGIELYALILSNPGTVPRLRGDSDAPGLGLFWWSYTHLLRPLAYVDELVYLDYMAQGELRWGRPARELAAAALGTSSADMVPQRPWCPIFSLFAPVVARTVLRRDVAIASRDLLQAALGIHLYHQRHGRYPASLAEVRALPWPIHEDIFSGRDFVYKPLTDGFLLYSLGQDLDDDGGRPVAWLSRHRPKPSAPKGGFAQDDGDLVWNPPAEAAPGG